MKIEGKEIQCNDDLVRLALTKKDFMDKYLKANNLTELKGKDFRDFEMYIFQQHYSHLLEDEQNEPKTRLYEWDNNLFPYPFSVGV